VPPSSGHGSHRRGAVHGPELAAGLRGPAQRGARRRGRRAGVLGRHRRRVRAELRGAAPGRLPADPLRRALRREPLLGLRRRRLVGVRRRGLLGVREAVLRPRHQQLRGGAGVRPLHAGGVARLHRHRLCPRRLRQQRRRLHHLQLQPAGQRRRREPLLDCHAYYNYIYIRLILTSACMHIINSVVNSVYHYITMIILLMNIISQ
jgi:hypothetical protein